MSTTDSPNYLTLGWNYLFRPKLDPLQMISDNKSVMGFDFDDFVSAVKYFQKGQNIGKIILKVNDE